MADGEQGDPVVLVVQVVAELDGGRQEDVLGRDLGEDLVGAVGRGCARRRPCHLRRSTAAAVLRIDVVEAAEGQADGAFARDGPVEAQIEFAPFAGGVGRPRALDCRSGPCWPRGCSRGPGDR